MHPPFLVYSHDNLNYVTMKHTSLFTLFVLILSTFSLNAQNIMPPAVPDKVVFAGEVITFERGDMRERMDRELIAFSYGHSNSILMIKRANRYFPQIEPILKAYGIPDDLKYLCVIESNLDPQAVSVAGAAGFWQFTKSTGRAYGLEVNDNIDERYNLKKATVAACKYLKEAYSKYGNWMTVAASYNAGQNGITKRRSEQGESNAMDMWLVTETSRYMFRLLVCKIYFSNPSQFGFYLKSEDLYPFIPAKDTVKVTATVPDLVAFAKKHGVSYAQLKRENLWLRGKTLEDKSGRTYKVAIPDIKAENYDPKKTKVHCKDWLYRPE